MKYKANNIIREIPMTWGNAGEYQGNNLGTAYLTSDFTLIIPPFKIPEDANETSAYYPILTIKGNPLHSKDNPACVSYPYNACCCGIETGTNVRYDSSTGQVSFKGNSKYTEGKTMVIHALDLSCIFMEVE